MFGLVDDRSDEQRVYRSDGVIQSIYPPESLFGFTFWGNMVPPYKPENVLILGYGQGTLSGLIHKIHGNVSVTGVDIVDPEIKAKGDCVLIGNALKFVEESQGKFDFIAIDIFNGADIPSFVFSLNFISALKSMSTGMVAINLFDADEHTSGVKNYLKFFDLAVEKVVGGNRIIFFKQLKDKNV